MQELKKNFHRAQIQEKDRTMLEYAVKLTLEPWNMIEADVHKLREAGFDDADILDINQITGYFAFCHRRKPTSKRISNAN